MDFVWRMFQTNLTNMLQIYYHSNYIKKLISLILNKLNALKYGNNTEIMKTFVGFKIYFLKIGVGKTLAKRFSARELNFSIKFFFFPNKGTNLIPFLTDVSIRFLILLTLGAVAVRNGEIMKPARWLVSKRLYVRG